MQKQNFIKTEPYTLVDADCLDIFKRVGLDTIDGAFAFSSGSELKKANISTHRTRIRFELEGRIFFLKRYQNAPKAVQIKNWLSHRKKASTASFDRGPSEIFESANIPTPKTVAIGENWSAGFEQQSFIITENLYDCKSLEKQLPPCFDGSTNKHAQRCQFIETLADFAKRFHTTGLRHRDFYLAHIFLSDTGLLYLIDLQRVFAPMLLSERFKIKDIAQLHYSTPGNLVSCADRIRFYKHYTSTDKLSSADKRFIKKVKAKAWRMADHDLKHGRIVPFAQ